MKNFDTNNSMELSILKKYLETKERVSKFIANNPPKLEVPKFDLKGTSVNAVADLLTKVNSYIQLNLKYASDPFWGSFDYYTHPYRILEKIQKKDFKDSCDCDDYATFAVFLYREMYKHKYKEMIDKATIVSIIPNIINSPSDIKWAHVIAVFSPANDVRYIIDTNGLTFIQDKPENLEKRILEHFSKLYNTRYFYYIDHGYPFEGE